ncbi:BREX system ATP-binding domain-containing protein [Paenibacillus aurantiacus]|uniref:BREX system ATP-binding domain-containing protein n=1 Tax=Paenibacillus aurantiacus TaxID=1936118 RepID=A0ABV5KLJ7_9BACL
MSLNHEIEHSSSWIEPRSMQFPGAALFIDIYGFTALSKQLTAQGAAGIEQISILLNTYFDRMLSVIYRMGGEVVQFAGDALLAVWSVDPDEQALEDAVLAAARCGLLLQRQLHDREMLPGLLLSLRMSIGAGDIESALIGGLDNEWELAMAGEALSQIHACSASAQAGRVLLSPEAHALIKKHYPAEATEAGSAFFTEAEQEGRDTDAEDETDIAPADPAQVSQVDWSAELRLITVLFLKFSHPAQKLNVGQLQPATLAIQQAMKLHGGTIHKISHDDKGSAVIAALGLPAHTHENDAFRAVRAALAIQERLKELGLGHRIGISTGLVFYGSIGNAVKLEYTMIGDAMNLAARLMQHAPEHEIRCDAATREAAGNGVWFRDEAPVMLKGLKEPQPLFTPLGLTGEARTNGHALVGREREIAELRQKLDLLAQGSGGYVSLIGEAGIGKSHLLQFVQREAAAREMTVLRGAADGAEQLTPYYPWRSIFHALLRLDSLPEDEGAKQAAVLDTIRQAAPDLEHLGPLLTPVLPFAIADNAWTKPMTGQIRADNTHALMVRLLGRFALERHAVIILDDGHWADSSSWSLLLQAASALPQALLIVASRPESELVEAGEQASHQLPSALTLRLQELSRDASLALIADRLGVERLPDAVGAFILSKSEGHPFFSEELAYAMRDSGVLDIRDGQCHVLRNLDELTDVHFPTTIQGIVRSRIDRLPQEEQLVLKVASVIGRIFTYAALDGTMPVASGGEKLLALLETLTEANLTLREPSETELTYLFKHVITQEVSYNLLLHSQRKQLHRTLASWYEAQYSDLSPYYGLLAYHWSKAEDTDKTAYYLERVGLQAQRTGAYQEAVGAFSALVGGEAFTESAASMAKWRRMLGEAYMGIGDMANASEQLCAALALYGRPVASTPGKFKRDIAREAARQLLHRVLPERLVDRFSRSRSELLLEQARCYWRLAEIAFFVNKPGDNLYHTLHGLNLAERAGTSPELAQISSNMCVTTGIMSLHTLAKAYINLSLRAMGQIEELSAEAWVRMNISLYYIGTAQWKASTDYSSRAMDIYEKMGNRRYWEASSYLMVKALAYHKADFPASTALAAKIYESGRLSGNAQAKSWGLLAQAENALYNDKLPEALRLLAEAESLIPIHIGLTEEIRLHNLLALVHLRTGSIREAERYARQGLTLTKQFAPTTYYSFDGYAALAEALLDLWQRESGDRTESRSALDEAIGILRRFAKTFPIALPRLHAYEGSIAWHEGDRERARKLWKRSLQHARKLDMPYEASRTEAVMWQLDSRS